MDRDVIIYIVMAIIYFVVRNLKKKPKAPEVQERRSQSDDDYESQPEPTSTPPMSFEDLLKELTSGGKTAQKPPQQPAPEPSRSFEFPSDGKNYEDVHDEWEDKEIATVKEGSHTRLFSDEETKRIYQESIHIDHSKDDELSAQLERAKSRFKEFEIKEEDNSAFRDEIVDMLSDQHGAKKAIILGEILNRKY
ncbi:MULTISPECIES: hypothetical protein [unclassified Imperialibacter]|uniref:hypothetical protein n=1 Tax=unclassified Imperialibacter TaxID=2629706 RepID=UPI00125B5E31|nr:MULTISPECIES: hypothetical protein [unclassified Imperialibacter]CAD5266557.1 conserved hypothetical protein [Imperialibacter sp. 89]CAD5281626.1 conserved hypothetical protein [Imperialibacter sp. 75]VVT16815.1 conserved hypothetical protein [Imperialibacter sp. EC-SDR9]